MVVRGGKDLNMQMRNMVVFICIMFGMIVIMRFEEYANFHQRVAEGAGLGW